MIDFVWSCILLCGFFCLIFIGSVLIVSAIIKLLCGVFKKFKYHDTPIIPEHEYNIAVLEEYKKTATSIEKDIIDAVISGRFKIRGGL